MWFLVLSSLDLPLFEFCFFYFSSPGDGGSWTRGSRLPGGGCGGGDIVAITVGGWTDGGRFDDGLGGKDHIFQWSGFGKLNPVPKFGLSLIPDCLRNVGRFTEIASGEAYGGQLLVCPNAELAAGPHWEAKLKAAANPRLFGRVLGLWEDRVLVWMRELRSVGGGEVKDMPLQFRSCSLCRF